MQNIQYLDCECNVMLHTEKRGWTVAMVIIMTYYIYSTEKNENLQEKNFMLNVKSEASMQKNISSNLSFS